jgi:hypothetical protein
LARHSTHFDELIDIAELKALSGEASFAKGLQLASQGRVQQTSYSSNHHDTLVQFYLELGRVQDACDWVANHRITPPLADAGRADLAKQSCAGDGHYFRTAGCYVDEGHNDGYQADCQWDNHADSSYYSVCCCISPWLSERR